MGHRSGLDKGNHVFSLWEMVKGEHFFGGTDRDHRGHFPIDIDMEVNGMVPIGRGGDPEDKAYGSPVDLLLIMVVQNAQDWRL
jgi:hypothetical protein